MLIELKNGDITGVVDTFGGELISFMDKEGTKYLWEGDEAFWTGRSPHLFPIIGTLKDGFVLIKEREFSLNKHGFARNSEFEIIESSENEVTLLLKSSENTKEFYPYQFSFFVTHTLTEKGFTTTYRILNNDNETMYFNIGGHVGVRCPINPDESFDNYQIEFNNKLSNDCYFPHDDSPINKESAIPFFRNENILNLSHTLFEKGPIIIDKINSHKLKLVNKKSKKGILFSFDDFPVLALWTFGQKKAPYICLEPWHGLPAMEDDKCEISKKPYAIAVEPKKDKSLTYSLELIAP